MAKLVFKSLLLLTFAMCLTSALPSDAATCGACAVSHDQCTANCAGFVDHGERVACLIACDNAAATCSCDERVTLRSEDLLPKARPEADAPACHSTTPCGSGYPSCASWSGYSDCGDPYCGIYLHCGDECEPGFPCPGPALRQWRERFRVCFNAQGQSCTEYQRTSTILSCGC
jgi:hypothetical protein